MELINQNREYIKGAVQMCLYNEQQAYGYPKEAFTFNVIKEGNFWELQFIYVASQKDIVGGDSGEWLVEDVTDSFKEAIPLECSVEDLVSIVQGALEVISKNEFKN